MTDRELMQMALDALEEAADHIGCPDDDDAIGVARKALRARLAQPEPEPVAWHEPGAYGNVTVHEKWANENGWLPLYTAPPQREWQGLTENEIKHLWYEACQTNLELTSQLIVHLARNIEAKLRAKNT
jgi:hypothetical protein